jgi:hypothetical protein
MSQKSSVPQAVSFVSQVLKRDKDTAKAAVSGNLISALQPFISAPMHPRRLIRKGIKNVRLCSQSG